MDALTTTLRFLSFFTLLRYYVIVANNLMALLQLTRPPDQMVSYWAPVPSLKLTFSSLRPQLKKYTVTAFQVLKEIKM